MSANDQTHSVLFLFELFKHEPCKSVDNATELVVQFTAFLKSLWIVMVNVYVLTEDIKKNMFSISLDCNDLLE